MTSDEIAFYVGHFTGSLLVAVVVSYGLYRLLSFFSGPGRKLWIIVLPLVIFMFMACHGLVQVTKSMRANGHLPLKGSTAQVKNELRETMIEKQDQYVNLGPERFESKTYDLSIKFPDDWVILKEPYRMVVVSSRGFTDPEDKTSVMGMNIVESQPKYPGDLDKFVERYLESSKKDSTFVLRSSGEEKIGGRSAKRLIFDRDSEGYPMTWLVYFLMRGDKGLHINCYCLSGHFEKAKPVFEQVVRSIEY